MSDKDNPFGTSPPEDPFGAQPPSDPFGRPIAGDDPFGPPPVSPNVGDAWNRPPSPAPGGVFVPPVPGPKADGAFAALVLGIVGVVLCQILGPFAWYLGRKAERLVDASGGVLGGRGEATAGKVLGIIGTVLLVLAIGFVILAIIGLAAADNTSGVPTYNNDF